VSLEVYQPLLIYRLFVQVKNKVSWFRLFPAY